MADVERIEVKGPELEAALERIRIEVRRVVAIERGPRNADWILITAWARPVQGLLRLWRRQEAEGCLMSGPHYPGRRR